MSHAGPHHLVVVDASLVAMWVLAEPLSPRATALASEWTRLGMQPIAPAFMLAEVTNAIFKRVYRAEITLLQAQSVLEAALRFGVGLEEHPDLHRRAMVLADRLARPSTYDAHYLALAELHTCEVWTGDERLYNAVGPQFPALRWVGTYQPTGAGP